MPGGGERGVGTPGTEPGVVLLARSVRVARASIRWGLVATALVLAVPAAGSLGALAWPLAGRAFLAFLLVITVAVHIGVSGRLIDRGDAQAATAVASAVITVAGAGLVAVATSGPEYRFAWAVVLGVAVSAWLMTQTWSPTALTAAGGLAAVAAAVVATTGSGWYAALVVVGLVLMPAVIDGGQLWFWRILRQLESARELAAELATARERERIAAELHDIQGQSLHLIAREAELVERLVAPGSPALDHARAVRTLAADALRETRSLVHGYRISDVTAELRNAADLLRATGADAAVVGDPGVVSAAAAAVLGPLVREATTNILRHSDAGRVEIGVEHRDRCLTLTVTNDGAHPAQGSPGTGVAGLHERFAQLGGSVRGERVGDRWILTAVLPDPGHPG